MVEEMPTEQPPVQEPQEVPKPEMQQTHEVAVGDRVQLNGTLFNIASGQYDWSMTGPDGAPVDLQNPTMPGPSFTAEKAGTYVAKLTTDDGVAEITVNAVESAASSEAPPEATPVESVPAEESGESL